MSMINAISLFSGAGIDEFYLKDVGVNVVLANEIVKNRAEAYRILHNGSDIICDDICKDETKDYIVDYALRKNVKLLIATPPCQGLSWAGANKNMGALLKDKRNFLILNALDIFDQIQCDYFVIENVPRFMEMLFPHGDQLVNLYDLLNLKYSNQYNIKCDVFDAANYGVPQTRLRVVFRLWKKNLKWADPIKCNQITLEDAIGDLPSLEAGESSNIKNHYARKHPAHHIECMAHTPTGKTAYDNEFFYPKKPNGEIIKGFKNTYKRMCWDKPAPTITMRNEIISSQENVHPGRQKADGTWSDARVLTLRELLIVSSLPADLDIPNNLSETAFRQIIGEGIPPKMFANIISRIGK